MFGKDWLRTVMGVRGSLYIAAAIGLTSSSAHAASPDIEQASALFEQGISESAAGRYETGCAAFDESYRLDPQLGALFAAAECHRQWGKVWAAVQHYRAYLAAIPALAPAKRARQGDRPERAQAALAQLEPQLPSQEPVAPSPAPAAHPTPAPAEAPPAVADDAAQPRSVLPSTAPPGTAPPGAAPPGTAPPSTAPPETALPATSESPLRIMGWSAAGVGAAGLVFASVAGVVVLSQKGVIQDECAPRPDSTGMRGCSERGLSAVHRSEDFATAGDVALGVGIVGLAAGALLLIGWPSAAAGSESAATPAWQPWLGGSASGLSGGMVGRW